MASIRTGSETPCAHPTHVDVTLRRCGRVDDVTSLARVSTITGALARLLYPSCGDETVQFSTMQRILHVIVCMSKANTQLTHSENLYRISCNGDRSKPHCNPASSVNFCVSSIALQFCPYLKIILDPSNTHSYTHLVGSFLMNAAMHVYN